MSPQTALTNMCLGRETCRKEEAEHILAMADLKGDRRVGLDQFLFTASTMSWMSCPKP